MAASAKRGPQEGQADGNGVVVELREDRARARRVSFRQVDRDNRLQSSSGSAVVSADLETLVEDYKHRGMPHRDLGRHFTEPEFRALAFAHETLGALYEGKQGQAQNQRIFGRGRAEGREQAIEEFRELMRNMQGVGLPDRADTPRALLAHMLARLGQQALDADARIADGADLSAIPGERLLAELRRRLDDAGPAIKLAEEAEARANALAAELDEARARNAEYERVLNPLKALLASGD